MVTITRHSPITGLKHITELDMTQEQYDAAYEAWQGGVLIQDAFPTLDADQREFIKTGMTPADWDVLYEGE
jgi:hypothetical protein